MRRGGISAALTAAALGVLLLVGAGQAAAAVGPVDAAEVVRTTSAPADVEPHVSPIGEQTVVWRDTNPAQGAYRSRWRTGGGSFGPIDDLTAAANAEAPGFAFDGQGRAFVYFGASPPLNAQQAIREPGGNIGAFRPLSVCGRFVDAAVAPDGRLAVGCSRTVVGPPPDSAALLRASAIGQPFDPPATPFGAVYDNFIQPSVAWGADGRLAMTVEMSDVTTSPPPSSFTDRLRTYVVDPGPPPVANLFEVDTAIYNAPLFGLTSTGTVLAGDGAVVVTSTSDDAGAKVHVRTPGSSFVTTDLPGWFAAAYPRTDAAGRTHAIVASNGSPYSYGVIIRPPGGNFGAVTPLTSPRPASSYLADFEVAEDGTEFALFSADNTGPVTVRVRPPGASGFGPPLTVAPAGSGHPEAAITPNGDLLVAWSHEASVGDFRIHVGGLDSGTRPTISRVEIPARALIGTPVAFAAQATDSMGIRGIRWRFSDGTVLDGADVSRRFADPGRYGVEVTATDRAGNRTSQNAIVEVFAPVGSDRRPPRLVARGQNRIRFRGLRRQGVRYRVRANERVRLMAQLVARPRSARISAAGDLILAERSINLARRARVIRLRPQRRLLGARPRNLRLRVRFSATDTSGNTSIVARVLRVRRR